MATREQYMGALMEANRVRCSRAKIKATIRDGGMSIGEALILPAVQSMTIGDLLFCQRRWGPARSARLLRDLAYSTPPLLIGQARLVSELTARERRAISERAA